MKLTAPFGIGVNVGKNKYVEGNTSFSSPASTAALERVSSGQQVGGGLYSAVFRSAVTLARFQHTSEAKPEALG
jgi:hypothetical protein